MKKSVKHFIQKQILHPNKKQDAIAIVLEEELKWNISFSKSHEILEKLSYEAVNEYRNGKTQTLSFLKIFHGCLK